ncbi:hypothetical protein [Corynebacterium sp. H130]|uniref:hypothetical protein n=1 Tax=Corynebacterium sp. H130 TaxID=3133444 RepID=UPI0030AF0D67
MSLPKPTATLHDGHRWEFRRDLPGTAEELWAWITVSERTEKWFGPFEKTSDTTVAITMTAEEEGPAMPASITLCEAPHTLTLDTEMWVLHLEVADGHISLFQTIDAAEEAGAIGAGWEFYLDCLAAAFHGEDVAAIDFEADYFPAMNDYFQSQY